MKKFLYVLTFVVVGVVLWGTTVVLRRWRIEHQVQVAQALLLWNQTNQEIEVSIRTGNKSAQSIELAQGGRACFALVPEEKKEKKRSLLKNIMIYLDHHRYWFDVATIKDFSKTIHAVLYTVRSYDSLWQSVESRVDEKLDVDAAYLVLVFYKKGEGQFGKGSRVFVKKYRS
jgi:hypothetical protein